MIQLYDAIISKCIVHFVGNRGLEEGIKYSNGILDINGVAKDTLCNYFYKPFVGKEDYYTFWHQTVNLSFLVTPNKIFTIDLWTPIRIFAWA